MVLFVDRKLCRRHDDIAQVLMDEFFCYRPGGDDNAAICCFFNQDLSPETAKDALKTLGRKCCMRYLADELPGHALFWYIGHGSPDTTTSCLQTELVVGADRTLQFVGLSSLIDAYSEGFLRCFYEQQLRNPTFKLLHYIPSPLMVVVDACHPSVPRSSVSCIFLLHLSRASYLFLPSFVSLLVCMCYLVVFWERERSSFLFSLSLSLVVGRRRRCCCCCCCCWWWWWWCCCCCCCCCCHSACFSVLVVSKCPQIFLSFFFSISVLFIFKKAGISVSTPGENLYEWDIRFFGFNKAVNNCV